MSRGLSAAYQTEYAKDQFAFAHLLDIQLDASTTEYVTDSYHDLTFNSNTYDAFGGLLSLGAINESSVLQIGRTDIILSGLETQYIDSIFDESFINNQVTIYRAIINTDTGAFIDTPRQIFDGNIVNYTISESVNVSTISIQVASNWANFMQLNGRITNPLSQNRTAAYKGGDFASDKGFQYASSAIADIKWGQS